MNSGTVHCGPSDESITTLGTQNDRIIITVQIHIVSHPLAESLLASLRNAATGPREFRQNSEALGTILALEATRNFPVVPTTVTTPIAETEGRNLACPLVVVPVLRAGLGMVAPFLQLFPEVAVGYIGLERNEQTAAAETYYKKLPSLAGKFCLCLDPMLATGGSAVRAIGLMKDAGATNIKMVSIVAAPEGVAHLNSWHPDVEIFTAALDDGLDDRKYIVPGLGDFGDRLFGTF
jgi:uracil phosphoribosyltransferase